MRSGWLVVASAMALTMGTAAAGEGVAIGMRVTGLDRIPLSSLPGARLGGVTAPFALSSNAPMRLTLASIALNPAKETPCR